MKITHRQATHRFIIALALFLTLGCTPAKALSHCDHEHPQNENTVAMPNFGFNLSGTCNEAPAEATPSDDAELEDALLKDIEEPLESPSSDLAATPATLKEEQPTS
ncbi:Secreted protein [Candidatus Electrothrix laxa]